MLAIGRALMTGPRLLMLDEPSQGIMPRLVDDILATVTRIRDGGVTVLLVKQRLGGALAIADRAYVLQTRRVVMSGAASEIAADAGVCSAGNPRAEFDVAGLETWLGRNALAPASPPILESYHRLCDRSVGAGPRTTRGGQAWYPPLALLTALTIRAVFRLA